MKYPWLAAIAFLLSADIADATTYKDADNWAIAARQACLLV
jgi:hypothetical protein